MKRALRVAPRVSIPASELHWTFVRSRGPGGQNVNKVNTKAVLRWSLEDSRQVPNAVRERFRSRYRRRINENGQLVLSSQRYRDQKRNMEDCLEKLRLMVGAVLRPPKPRRPTRPPAKAVEARLREKRAVADKKKQRRTRPGTEA